MAKKRVVKRAKKSIRTAPKEEKNFKVAINGFGRIGKQFFLAAMNQNVPWEFVINELGDLNYVVYSLKYDSVHETPKEKVLHDGKHLYFGDKKIRVYNEIDSEKLPWDKEKVDLVVDCTGHYTDAKDARKHIDVGARKVLISAPAKGNDVTIVPGVNDSMLKEEHKIVSAGSCTTNCVAPMVKILNDVLKIKSVQFITAHAYTATQKLIDSQDKKDFRRGRAAALNMAPSTSGASQSVIEAVPELKGKLDGYAIRVPVADGSIVSVVAEVERKTNTREVNEMFKKMAEKQYQSILKYTNEQIVSSDIIGSTASCIFDSSLTSVNGNLVSITGWYDNEMGYSYRLVDVARMMLEK